MSREDELTAECETVREQVDVLAEQVGRLLDVIGRQDADGHRMAVLETLMWKLHQRHMRLRSDISYGYLGDRTLN